MQLRFSRRTCGTALIVFLLTSWGAVASAKDLSPFFKKDALRVLILSGRNNHDWRTSTPFLRQILDDTGRFDVRVDEEPSGITADSLSPYDLVILDYQGPRWGVQAEEALAGFVRGGKGLVVFHGASYAFSGLEVLGDQHAGTGIREEPWTEYIKLTGGIWSEKDPHTAHGRIHNFRVAFVDKDHPVTRGLGDDFSLTDELYHDLRMLPEAHVLATAFSAPETGGTGEAEPILWTLNYGQGRIFHTALGHNLVAIRSEGFTNTFARGCEWAASGQVTLPSDVASLSHSASPVRALLVTGGHDYDSEFYQALYHSDVRWEHAVSNEQAFASDITEKYDVLILYDLSNELSEKGRVNLRRFLEQGKGVLILHHAIADYNGWEWWWKEVVGGKYVLEAEPGFEASTYQHDVHLNVTPTADHPITRGLSEFDIVDETYKRMWISDKVNVLLRTDHATSDGPVAWISPYRLSRVVYVQLGHDRLAHLHPVFQTLVRNSVLWTAERLE